MKTFARYLLEMTFSMHQPHSYDAADNLADANTRVATFTVPAADGVGRVGYKAVGEFFPSCKRSRNGSCLYITFFRLQGGNMTVQPPGSRETKPSANAVFASVINIFKEMVRHFDPTVIFFEPGMTDSASQEAIYHRLASQVGAEMGYTLSRDGEEFVLTKS